MSQKNTVPLFPLPSVPPQSASVTDVGIDTGFCQKLYRDFYSFSASKASKTLEKTSPAAWERAGQDMALEIFHAAAKRVPAYKDFLQKHKIQPEKIKRITDFKHVPEMDKDNYLRKYELSRLCWDGKLHSAQMIAVSSGSTGNPFFWPRGLISELETTYIFELFLEELFKTQNTSTLFVNAFAMGMYVGGPITLNTTLRVAQKGHLITVTTPGYSLKDVIRVIKELGPAHGQIILASYPPFAKDILAEGEKEGLDWKKIQMKFVLAGEGFNESWRDYMAEISMSDPVRDFINIYGTADAAVLGHESPVSILLRKSFDKTTGVRKHIFGEERLPSFLHYYPFLRYFQVNQESELLFTASAGVPLVRYNIHDKGGVMPYDEAFKKAEDLGIDINTYLKDSEQSIASWKLPFVYLFGRSDFTTTFYGANIYPENIKAGLESKEVRSSVTGKFTMFTDTDDAHDQVLNIYIECDIGVQPSKDLKNILNKCITRKLLDLNSEYNVVFNSRGDKANPTIHLCRYGDPEYFAAGVKHQWVIKKK